MTQFDRIIESIDRNEKLLKNWWEDRTVSKNPISNYFDEIKYDKYYCLLIHIDITVRRFSGNERYSENWLCNSSVMKYYTEVPKQKHWRTQTVKLKENALDLIEEDLGEIEKELSQLV